MSTFKQMKIDMLSENTCNVRFLERKNEKICKHVKKAFRSYKNILKY